MVLSGVEVTAFNGQCNRLQITEKHISCSLTQISDYSFCLFTKFLVFFFTWFPQESNISCGINSCVDWQIIASAWVASHQSHSPQATFLRLSISCQPSLSETHARSSFPRILWVVTNWRHWTFHLWQKACSGSLVSGTHSSSWKKPFFFEENAALVRWQVFKFNACTCFPHRLREDGSAIIKPCLCEFVFRGALSRRQFRRSSRIGPEGRDTWTKGGPKGAVWWTVAKMTVHWRQWQTWNGEMWAGNERPAAAGRSVFQLLNLTHN